MLRQQRMNDALINELKPAVLTIEDESNRHHGINIETHFKIIIVSSRFIGLSRIARHRLVNACVHDEFSTGLHALSLHLYTPEEWQRSQEVPNSPACRDGKRHDNKSFN